MNTEELFDENFKQIAIKKGHAKIEDGVFVFTERGEGFREGIAHIVDFAIRKPEEFNCMIKIQEMATKGLFNIIDNLETDLDKKIGDFLKGFKN